MMSSARKTGRVTKKKQKPISKANKEKIASGLLPAMSAPPGTIKTIVPSAIYNDVDLGATAAGRDQVALTFNTTGTITLLNGLVQSAPTVPGTHQNDVVRFKSFAIDAVIFLPTYTVPGPFVMRMALIFDRKPRGTMPTASTLFSANVNSAGEAFSIYAGMNGTNASRFTVLKEWAWNANGFLTGSGAVVYPPGDKAIIPIKFKKRISLLTEYAGESAASTIAGITSGAFYLASYGNASPGSAPYVAGLCRVVYEDAK